MKQPMRLERHNLRLLADHLDRLDRVTHLSSTISRRRGRDTLLAETLEQGLLTGLKWSEADMLHVLRPYWEAPYWQAVGAIVQSRRVRP